MLRRQMLYLTACCWQTTKEMRSPVLPFNLKRSDSPPKLSKANNHPYNVGNPFALWLKHISIAAIWSA
uniref:Uncharacterized protein n=1 Tax=Arundo donax TaxID=35708 RepID=A0A0A9G8F6_ARUDO